MIRFDVFTDFFRQFNSLGTCNSAAIPNCKIVINLWKFAPFSDFSQLTLEFCPPVKILRIVNDRRFVVTLSTQDCGTSLAVILWVGLLFSSELRLKAETTTSNKIAFFEFLSILLHSIFQLCPVHLVDILGKNSWNSESLGSNHNANSVYSCPKSSVLFETNGYKVVKFKPQNCWWQHKSGRGVKFH